MANAIRYSTTGDTQSLKKGNFFFGVGDVGKGPSSATTYYNGSTPVASGYTIYSFDASQTSRISYASPTTDSEFISITNAKSGQNFTGVTQCLDWYATQSNYVCVNKDYEGIISNGLVFNVDAGYTPSYPRINNFLGDLGGNISYNVKNISRPLTNWDVKRSDISLISNNTILPPFSGAQVWSSTINTSTYANTLHRVWNDGSTNGVIGTLGQGFYRYYMWVRGKSTNSSGATISIDISDGSSPGSTGNILIGTNEQWQLLSCWDNGGSGYSVSKFFDYFLTGVNGDTYYVSSIAIVRSDVSNAADLKPLFTFPGYLNYSATTTSELDGFLTNGTTYNSNYGGAMFFDGVDDNINCSTLLQQFFTGRTPYSVEVWSKWNPQSGYRMVASNEESIGVGRDGVCLTLFSANTTNALVYHERFGSNNQVAPSLSVPLAFVSNSPFHTVATYDGTSVKVYVNGSGSTESMSTANITNTTTSFRLGSRGGLGNYFSGNIYNARIYSRSLSATEVLQNYQAQFPRFLGKNIVMNGLVNYLDAGYNSSYPGSGTTWNNISGVSGGTGTLTNGVAYSGSNGGYFDFDGTNDFVDIPYNSYWDNNVFGNATNFTISCWAKCDSFFDWSCLIQKAPTASGFYASSEGASLWVNSSGFQAVFGNGAVGSNPSGYGTLVSFTTTNTNGWFHLLFTGDGTTGRLYVNGSLFSQSSLSRTATVTTSLNGPKLGVRSGPTYYNGKIANTLLYTRPLSATEVLQNYQAQLPTIVGENFITNGLVLYLDAGYGTSYPTTGTTWNNVSGVSGGTGTLTNGPTYSSANGGSILFDGVNDYGRVTNVGLTGNITISFTFWGKVLTNPSADGGMVLYGTQGTSNQVAGIYYRNSDSYVRFTAWGSTGVDYATGFLKDFNIWHYWSLVYNGSTVLIYRDGVPDPNGAQTRSLNFTTSVFEFGGATNNNSYLNQNISNTSIYNRILSANEILQNFNAQKSRFGL